ncbi:Uncharacterised protein [Grimontia hollisae]|nr:Uncharacterised protein [Grimontia hollisae]
MGIGSFFVSWGLLSEPGWQQFIAVSIDQNGHWHQINPANLDCQDSQ